MSVVREGENITFGSVIRLSVSHIHLYVGKDKTVRDIQDKFSEIFPHLSISLFRHTGDMASLTDQDILFAPETKLNEINPDLVDGKLEMDSHLTVATFESLVFSRFGLFVQVSRNNRKPEVDKFGIDQYALDVANRLGQEKILSKDTILFRDVPYGC